MVAIRGVRMRHRRSARLMTRAWTFAGLVALMISAPAIAQAELEALKRQVEEQRSILDRQQKMLEEQQKVIERLQRLATDRVAVPSKETSADPPNETAAPSPKQAASTTPKETGSVPSQAAPAGPSVEIYGSLYPLVESISATDATAPAPVERPNQLPAAAYTGTNQGRRTRLTLGTSNIGFRGTIDIGERYKALWQIEAGAAFDGDSAAIGGTNVFGLRNSAVGISGPFGTAFFGNWDTPYKWAALSTNILRGGQSFDNNNLIGNPGFGVPGTTTQSTRANGKVDAAFDRRQGNSVQYWTPTWNGFSGRLAYSFDEGKSGSTSTPVISPWVFGAAVSYDSGPLVLRYAYELHNDYFGMSQMGGSAPSVANSSSRDTGNKIVAQYAFGDTTVSGIYEWLRYSNDDHGDPANVASYRRNAYYILAQQRFGPSRLWAAYGSTTDGRCSLVGSAPCNSGGLSATEWVGGYTYNVNKYLDLYAVFYDIRNGVSGTYQPVTQLNVPLNTTPAPGLNIRSFGGGMLLSF
jgi:predicted porin